MLTHFKRLAKQVLVYGLGDTINKIIAILIVPVFTRYLTPADYGVAGILTVTNSLIVGLADLGLTSALTRFFKSQKEPTRSHLVYTVQLTALVLTSIIAVFVFLFAKPISEGFFNSPNYSYIIILNFLVIPPTLLISAPMMRLRLEEKSRTFVFFNVSRVVTGLLLNVFLIVFLKRGINGLFEGPLINATLYALIISFYSFKPKNFAFSKVWLKRMFLFGYPLIFSSISVWIINWADRFILAKLTNLSEVGLYTLGYSVGMAILLPVGAFSAAWTPFYMSMHTEPKAKKIFSMIGTYYLLIISFFVLLLAIFSRDYFYFLTPEKFHSAYIIVPLITAAYAMKGLFNITAIGSYLAKKTQYVFITEIIALVINIGLMFLLIPTMGRMGAAWATIAAYLALPILIFVFTYKIYPIKYEYRRIIQIIFIGAALYFACKLIYQPTLWNLILRLLLSLTYPIYFLIFGFFSKDEIKRLKMLKLRNTHEISE